MSLQAIRYSRGSLELLDQRRLPFETVYLRVQTPQDAWTQIKDMVVRGAPAIGVTGALALAVDLVNLQGSGAAFSSVADAVSHIQSTMDYLVTSRPTAVNLADSANKLKAIAARAAAAEGATPSAVVAAVVDACESFLDEDIKANRAMGSTGAEALLAAAAARGRGTPEGRLRVLTHCNTGSLATAGFGTALGVIRALHESGKLEHAYCTETRPYNQGARLTAFELVHDGLPATLICDSAAASLMASGKVDAVVVGADRVVANGDTANKIGTYMLSIVAAHHNIPFFIAAPTTTLDPNLPDGSAIEIEQRSPEEITHFKGQRVAADNIKVWNPAFDVAPGKLIKGIITERGMVPKDAAGEYQVQSFMAQLGLWSPQEGAANGHAEQEPAANGTAQADGPAAESGFYALDVSTVKDYVLARPHLCEVVGPVSSAPDWSVREVGDGNINFVYILQGPAGKLCIKQALPFVRCVGESWPLSQDRVRIEAEALMEEARHCPAHVPKVYLFDRPMGIIAMQFIEPPILRGSLIAGQVFPHLADHVSSFLAHTLFSTSLLCLDSATYRSMVTKYTNPEMCALTEQVIFTEPYTHATNNRWTSPQLDADVAELQSDVQAKVAISYLKELFCTKAEALLHGDLHTGSIMASETDTYMIDPEFAYYGPIAFDVAKILANLLLCFFSLDGHEAASGNSREEQRGWLLQCMNETWSQFHSKFLALWSSQGLQGCLTPDSMLGEAAPAGPASFPDVQAAYFQRLWREVVMFMGAFLIRRLVGIAHVKDMDSIADPEVRATCERRALRFGRRLLTQPEGLADVGVLLQEAQLARQ